MIAHQLVSAVAVVFPGIRQLNALGEVKPCLLAFGEMRQEPGIEQEIVVIGFAARNHIGRAR